MSVFRIRVKVLSGCRIPICAKSFFAITLISKIFGSTETGIIINRVSGMKSSVNLMVVWIDCRRDSI